MPKTRQNKDRKDKLNKFKNQQKHKSMSENNSQMPEIKKISQVPVWTQDAKFELSGGEFMALQNFFTIFAEPVQVMQQIFARHMEAGTIQIRYQDPAGNEIPKEDVDAYLKQMQDYFAKQNAEATTTEGEFQEGVNPKKLAKPSKKVPQTEDSGA